MAILPVIIDFESVEIQPDGTTKASTEAYRSNFRVSSMAAAWRNEGGLLETRYLIGEHDCESYLMTLARLELPVVAHNIQFEKLVMACRFPRIQLNWHADTMRLAQLYDNGGDKNLFEYIVDEEWAGDEADTPIKKKPLSGLGLVVCNKRILGGADHKREAYDWIRANIPDSAGHEGSYLDRLPDDIMERYNTADTTITLELYEFIMAEFEKKGFDWSLDNSLYMSTVQHLVKAKIKGAPVDRETLKANIAQIADEMAQIGNQFAIKYSKEIGEIESARIQAYVNKPGKKPLTDKVLQKRRDRIRDKGLVTLKLHFNVGSNKQLEELFKDRLGMSPKFFTKKGAPSFRSVHLNQWGEGGSILARRRKLLIVLKQCENLLKLSEYDGRWHSSLRAAGTSTGRFIGSN